MMGVRGSRRSKSQKSKFRHETEIAGWITGPEPCRASEMSRIVLCVVLSNEVYVRIASLLSIRSELLIRGC